MAQQQPASVIRRKTRAAREGADPRVMSPVRALRLALARAADTLLDLPLVVATVEQRRVEAGEVEDALGTEGLYLLLDGAAGTRAAMRLCPGLVSALIEMQTAGHVRPGEVRPRPPTRTDAAMVAPLVDALLAGFDVGMGAEAADHAPRGFHFGDRVEDGRALSLLMVAPEFDFFRLTTDLGPGLRTGRLDLLLPLVPTPPARNAGASPPGRIRRGTDARGPEDLATVALAAPVALDAVLARIRLPLREAMALEVGQRLMIAKDSLGRVRLAGVGGHVAAEGRLGRCDGWRALRLSATGAQGRGGDQHDRDAAPRVAPPSGTTGTGAAVQDTGAQPDETQTPRAAAAPPERPATETTGPKDQAPDTSEDAGDSQTGTALAPVSG